MLMMVAEQVQLFERASACFTDHRDPSQVAHQWHSFSGFCHSVKDSVLGLGYPLIFCSVSELPVPVIPFFAATFRPVFGIFVHRTYPDGSVADTGRSR